MRERIQLTHYGPRHDGASTEVRALRHPGPHPTIPAPTLKQRLIDAETGI